MHAADILYYGHETVKAALNELDPADWTTPGVCGVWSVKEIMAHLSAAELVLVEVLAAQLEPHAPTPLLDERLAAYSAGDYDGQNQREVERRAALTVAQVWQEYEEAYHQVAALLAQLPPEQLRRTGQLPWYGDEYDIEDMLVYAYYAHKREHMAQVNIYRDRLREVAEAGQGAA